MVAKAGKITISSSNIFERPPGRIGGSLSDLYVHEESKIIICAIEKVASSELKKVSRVVMFRLYLTGFG